MSTPPTLTSEIVADVEAVWSAIVQALRDAPDLRQLQQEIVRRQKALRSLTAEPAWRAYLKVEQAHTARLEEVSLVLVRWAFAQGQRHGEPQP